MSRCRQTDALLDATFTGDGLTQPQTDHALGCAECARTLALARRFDGELQRVGGELAALHATDAGASQGGREMWRIPGLLVTAAAVVAIAVLGAAVLSNAWLGQLQTGRIGADELTKWLEWARAATHEELDRGGQTDIEDWEPAQVEICGDTVVALFERAQEPGIGYRWAVGRPGDWLDRSIDIGSSRTLAAPDVAERRVGLPVCTFALGPDGPDPLEADVEIAPQQVVRVPDLWWSGDLDRAPFEVEVIGGGQDVLVPAIISEGYLLGRLDDPSIRAIDLVTEAGRYRYTVAAPGFIIQADPGDGQIGYELFDAAGSVVANGWVREVGVRDDGRARHEEEARRAQAEAAARAEAARRALDAHRVGATCADWARMTDVEQLGHSVELLAGAVERVRVRQQLPADATWSEIMTGAQASLDRGCQGSPADRLLENVAVELYGDD